MAPQSRPSIRLTWSRAAAPERGGKEYRDGKQHAQREKRDRVDAISIGELDEDGLAGKADGRKECETRAEQGTPVNGTAVEGVCHHDPVKWLRVVRQAMAIAVDPRLPHC